MKLLVALIALMTFSVSLAGAASDDVYLHAGRLVDIGGFRLNIVCMGTGAPTVVFDSGLEDWAPAWALIQPPVSRITRTCTYDRAGNGLSDRGPLPRTSSAIVGELHRLLGAAGEKPPYILVGHSFGGYTARLFADRYLPDVAGLVLVDSSNEDEPSLTPPSQRAKESMQWKTFLHQLEHCMHVARATSFAGHPKEKKECPSQFFRGLPERKFSARLNAELLREARAWKQYEASLSEAQNFLGPSSREVRARQIRYGAVPLRVLTATRHYHFTKKTTQRERTEAFTFERGWQRLQHRWLSLSRNSRQVLAQKSGHYIQLDQPDLVLEAIREEIDLVKSRP
ncbi:MAG: alpha/beta fold hydrolase [Candidatus Baltobacteraceae bacterium]